MLFFRTTSNEIIVSNLVCVIEWNKNKNCEQFFDNLLQSQVQMFCLSGKSTKLQQLWLNTPIFYNGAKYFKTTCLQLLILRLTGDNTD